MNTLDRRPTFHRLSGSTAHRATAELLKAMAEHLVSLKPHQRVQLLSDLGCDCSLIATTLERGDELIDLFVRVRCCMTNSVRVIRGSEAEAAESLYVWLLDLDDDDTYWALREFEPNCGHGMKWFRINQDELRQHMERLLPAPPSAKQIAGRVFWLAYQASSPRGLGALHYREDLTEDQILDECWDDRRQEFSGDYVAGRMIKLSVPLNLEIRDPHPEYQSWHARYPTAAALIDEAKKSLRM